MSIIRLIYVSMYLMLIKVKQVYVKNKIVKIPYHINPNNNNVYINLNIGLPLQSVTLPISLRSRISTISSISYPNRNENIICDSLIVAGNGFFISSYCFNYLPNTIQQEEISFSFKPRNKTHSFIHSLKENNQIDLLQFALFPKYFNDTCKLPRGILYCGGVDDNVFQSYDYVSKCKVSKVSANWGCFLSYAIFYEPPGKYPINYYVRFDYNEKYIYVPKKFIDLLLEYLHNKGGTCKLINTTNPQEWCIQCQYNVVHKFNEISFVIDNGIFNLKSTELFECVENNRFCLSIIRYNINAHYGWLFGSMFLYNYGIVYDIDDLTINFYSKTPFTTSTSLPHISHTKYTNIIKQLYIMNISLFTLMLINNIFIIKSKI